MLPRHPDHGRQLDQKAELIQLVEIMLAQHRYPEAAVANHFDQALASEVEQGLTDRGGRDAQLGGEIGDRMQLAGADLAGHDATTDDASGPVPEAGPVQRWKSAAVRTGTLGVPGQFRREPLAETSRLAAP